MGQEQVQSSVMFSPRFKAKPPQGTGGIWTPKNQTPSTSTTDLRDEKPFAPLTPLTPATPPPPPPPAQPIWTPQPSPTQGRREFRPIRFESPTLPRRYVLQPPAVENSSNAVQPPWSSQGPLAATGLPPPHQQPVSPRSATSCTNLTTPTSIESGSTNTFEFCAHDVGSSNGGYGGRPTGVSDKIRTFERSASASELSRPFRRLQDRSRPAYRPNEVIYKVQQEYMSEPETEYDKPRKMAQIRPRQYDGIGPTTNDGMPIILRSEVKAPHQHEWYKRLYQTIHKQKNGEDYVIRYKCPRGRNQYKSSGYQSEPEPSYPSSLDRRRLQTVSSSSTNVRGSNNNVYQQDDKLYGSMPNPIKSGQSSYKNQPGRIEDYVTGHSSVSEKERKEWWDEVMDIFNGHWDQQKLSPHYTEGNLSRALAKESGYTSDSNLVFRKKEIPVSSPLSPVEQKVAYKQVQAGGEPPLFGFRKPAPEKSKDYDYAPPVPTQPPPRSYIQNGNASEEELALRQAEQMQRLYQEERRRKYLQELQDMNSRRHTDNFTPSQKSPIPLNRYDDFPLDVTLTNGSANGPKAIARALYNFNGQNARELTLKKGDIIYIRRQIDKNWYEGEHNASIGLFPANYVEIINKDVSKRPTTASLRKPSEGQARAKYNFQAQSGVELSLNKGELVTLTRRVDDNWFEGKIANRKGIFPVNYVEVLTDIGAEDIAAKTVVYEQSTVNMRPTLDMMRTNINNEFNSLTQNGNHPANSILKETKVLHKTDILHVDTSSEPIAYRALYKYKPQNSDELELLEGDLVQVLEKCDDGWFVGTSQRTGCFGTFPGNYVERA